MHSLRRCTLSVTIACAVALSLAYNFQLLSVGTYTADVRTTMVPAGGSVPPEAPPPPPSIRSVHLADFTYLHWPEPCSLREPQPLLLAAVVSAPSNLARRRLLRRLHASLREHRGFGLRWVFILGAVPSPALQADVDREAARFGDIVQLTFRDSYENLTLKTLAAMDWATAACPGAKFFIKTDVDSMFNPYRTVEFLLSLKPSESYNLYAGAVPYWLEPNRQDGVKKWRVTYENYPLVKFPPYAVGAGYLLSRGALFKVFAASDATFPMRLEDAYVGLCAMLAGLAPKHLPRIFVMDTTRHYADWCQFRLGIVAHPVEEAADMARMWRNIAAAGGYGCGDSERRGDALPPTAGTAAVEARTAS